MRDVSAMDEARAADSGSEIELAREKPFQLAGTRVRPASLELEFQSETITVEPRVMQVLVALSRARGEPTSRRWLMTCCWGRRLVTEGALNRSIAQLRKALRDPGIQIITIPRVGYRLQAASAGEPPQMPTVSAAGVIPRSALDGRRPAQVAVAVALALLALTVAAWALLT